ncbi:MAG: hypothetical protein J2P48_24835, partial [Alphaproteobacteria bacterium]|nr:hypothetical protein [Alphaproteobacteria bacterium]
MAIAIRNLLKALPLGVCLPLVIAAASVGPDDAVSNISKWTQWFGFRNPPDWLTSRSADQWVI